MTRYVSDAIVDVLRNLGCRYLPVNPGSSIRGLHDSLVEQQQDGGPELILCTHEEIAVAAAHAYAKATGDVAYAAVHDLVGLMHASMAVYDAWCDRAPLVLLGGGGPADPARRRPVDWFHSANTQSSLVRHFVKWDEDPVAAQATLDAIAQAHRIAASAPKAPCYVTIDAAVQEEVAEGLTLRGAADACGDPPFAAAADDVSRACDALLSAERPVVVAGRVGLDAAASELVVVLAEALGAACRDERNHSAIPTRHPLNLNGDPLLMSEADVVLAVDLHDLNYVLAKTDASRRPRIIDVSHNSLAARSWANAGAGLQQIDQRLVAEPRLALEQLLAEVRRRLAGDESEVAARRAERARQVALRHDALRVQQAEYLASRWEETPISVPRLVAETYEAVRDLPWLLTLRNTRSWPEGVWEFDRGGRYLGHSGGGGIGYGPGALLGGGLAARDRGEFAVGIIGDGDLLFGPGALWTAVHHNVPMLVVVNNNQSYLNDEEHQRVVAAARGRPLANALVGTRIDSPKVDFAQIARGHGAWATGPITEADSLAEALAAAVKHVLEGRVALVDVHCAS